MSTRSKSSHKPLAAFGTSNILKQLEGFLKSTERKALRLISPFLTALGVWTLGATAAVLAPRLVQTWLGGGVEIAGRATLIVDALIGLVLTGVLAWKAQEGRSRFRILVEETRASFHAIETDIRMLTLGEPVEPLLHSASRALQDTSALQLAKERIETVGWGYLPVAVAFGAGFVGRCQGAGMSVLQSLGHLGSVEATRLADAALLLALAMVALWQSRSPRTILKIANDRRVSPQRMVRVITVAMLKSVHHPVSHVMAHGALWRWTLDNARTQGWGRSIVIPYLEGLGQLLPCKET